MKHHNNVEVVSAIHMFRNTEKDEIATESYINFQLVMNSWQSEELKQKPWVCFVLFHKHAYAVLFALLIQNGSCEVVTAGDPTLLSLFEKYLHSDWPFS